MGTSRSFGGTGGKQGRDLRQGMSDWLDGLPDAPPPDQQQPDGAQPDGQLPLPELKPETILNVVPMFRPRGSGGGGDGLGGIGGGGGRQAAGGDGAGGGRRGGARRSATQSATTAGRAAAAAYALRTGDTATLEALGLDYNELRAIGDSITVTQRIVEAACGPLPDGTIEDDERRQVAAEIADWVLVENEGGAPPQPEEIVREAIARIIFEAATTETAKQLRDGKRPEWATREGERQIRECAEALAQQARLSPDGPTVEEFERAIEHGIDTLRHLWSGSE